MFRRLYLQKYGEEAPPDTDIPLYYSQWRSLLRSLSSLVDQSQQRREFAVAAGGRADVAQPPLDNATAVIYLKDLTHGAVAGTTT